MFLSSVFVQFDETENVASPTVAGVSILSGSAGCVDTAVVVLFTILYVDFVPVVASVVLVAVATFWLFLLRSARR